MSTAPDTGAPVKVSVIVATYQPGERIARVIRSLDAQTMPADEFEVILVDDGSPDDTVEQLRAWASERDNYRVERIDNSGWASRPRNVGIGLARGEYLLFLDHDDEVYPDGLRAAYDFGRLHHADVVNGKEARTHDAEWAIDVFREDQGQVIGRPGLHPLIPTNPHKLYRRSLLEEQGIRFPEGGRVLWEDIIFNARVARHARVVSTLASTPFYHWVTMPGSTSTGFLRSNAEWWDRLDDVLASITSELDVDPFQRDQLLFHQYRARLLSSFNTAFPKRPQPEQDQIFSRAQELTERYFPLSFDAQLPQSLRLRAALLRIGRKDLISEVAAADAAVPVHGELTGVRWESGSLLLDYTVEWRNSAGAGHPIERVGGRLLKSVTAEAAAAVPADVLDVTEEVRGATVEVGMRSRRSRVTWMLPSATISADFRDDAAAGGAVTALGSAVLDPRTAVFGGPLEAGAWDGTIRATLGGVSRQPRLHTRIEPLAAVVDGRSICAYRNAEGYFSVAIDESHSVLALAEVTPRSPSPAEGPGLRVAVALAGVHIDGEGRSSHPVTIEKASLSSLLGRVWRTLAHRVTGRPVAISSWTPDVDVTSAAGRATATFEVPGPGRYLIRSGDPGSPATRYRPLRVTAQRVSFGEPRAHR